MVKTLGMIHPEAEFFSSYETMQPNKLCTSKIQWWLDTLQTFPFQRGEIGRWKGVGFVSPKQVQKLARQIPLGCKS